MVQTILYVAPSIWFHISHRVACWNPYFIFNLNKIMKSKSKWNFFVELEFGIWLTQFCRIYSHAVRWVYYWYRWVQHSLDYQRLARCEFVVFPTDPMASDSYFDYHLRKNILNISIQIEFIHWFIWENTFRINFQDFICWFDNAFWITFTTSRNIRRCVNTRNRKMVVKIVFKNNWMSGNKRRTWSFCT